ncbi:hypothetical protein MHU86_14150 [Fragilaria crotonensis]|nr:hypothetical protein MHU86_14150 [Fragilaria crotonensis]
MPAGADPPSFLTMQSLPPDDDPIFGFRLSKWFEPTEFNPSPPETKEERYKRLHDEADYRHSTNPTYWHRYATLGRYVVDGNTFDHICQEFESDPTHLHLLIWFQYMYHVDRKMDIPQKLDDWATKRSQAYLAIHVPHALHLDTTKVSWKTFENMKPVNNPWKTVAPKSRQKSKQKSNGLSTNTPVTFFKQNSVTPPIAEETEDVTDVSEQPPQVSDLQDIHTPRKEHEDLSDESIDGKMSALIPNLNVPVNDGTMRVILRWKTTVEVSRLSQSSSQMTATIYGLLNELFTDEDGLLYKWSDEGLENFNSISKMSPAEVRSYISPSITIMPGQSMIIIPLRFGFTGRTSTSWRNQNTTKSALDRNNVTVGFSNSKSTSGKLVISGYILLKAPRTTHRLRYLQSLRTKLSENTPAFDILLHRRTPLEQEINHLVVQCGENHVHPLSQALLATVDGSGAGVYIPRFAFARMSREQAMSLFEKHDSYIKALRFVALSPMINNLDTIRTEYFQDGTKVERSVRDWAATIMSPDGTESAHCDVVNGGYDQKSFLLMPPQYEATVRSAFEDYRRRIFPFTQREERFRENIGPPPSVIHIDSKVMANLQFLEKLSSSTTKWKSTDADLSATVDMESNSAASSLSKESYRPQTSSTPGDNRSENTGDDSAEQVKRPPTPLESLKNLYQQRSTDNTTASSTSSTTASERSRQSMLTTSSARFIELEARITRQQTEFDRKDKISSDRLSQIERQLHRFDDVDSKLDTLRSDIDNKFEVSRNAQTEELKNMSGQIFTVMEKQVGFGASINILSDKISLLMGLISEKHQAEQEDTLKLRRPSPNSPPTVKTAASLRTSGFLALTHLAENANATNETKTQDIREEDGSVSMKSSESKSSTSTESEKFRSPEKKKQRPGTTNIDHAYSTEVIDDMNTLESTELYDSMAMPHSPFITAEATHLNSDGDEPSQSDLDNITTDLESRYNTQNSPDRCDAS